MVKVPEDVKKKIKSLAKNTETPLEELQKRFGEIMKEDEVIATMDTDDETKMRVAVGTLMREYVSSGSGIDYEFRVISKSAVRIVGKDRRKVRDIYAIARELDEDSDYVTNDMGEVVDKYAPMTLWQEAADASDKLDTGNVYKGNFVMKRTTDWAVVLNTNESTFTEVKESSIPTVKEFYLSEIKPLGVDIDISKADLNIADQNNPLDFRELEATVIRARKGVDKNEKEYATYAVIDDTSGEEFTIWVSPDMMKYGVGSDLRFIGEIREGKDGKLNMNAHFCIPAREHSVTPLRLEPQPVASEGPKQAQIDANVPEERDEKSENKPSNEPSDDFDF